MIKATQRTIGTIAILGLLSMHVSHQAGLAASEVEINGVSHRVTDGRVEVPLERVVRNAKAEMEAGRPFEHPTMLFMAELTIGQFGVFRSQWCIPVEDPDRNLQLCKDTATVVTQRLSDTEALVSVRTFDRLLVESSSGWIPRKTDSDDFDLLFSGFDFSQTPDGANIDLDGRAMIVSGLHEYTTVTGAGRSVLKMIPATLPPLPAKPPGPPPIANKAFSPGELREWVNVTGKHKTRGIAIDFNRGKLSLWSETKDEVIEIELGKLSKPDQEWIRRHLLEHRKNK